MGSLGLPVHTRVLAGTEERSRPFKRAGVAQEALEIVAEADLEDTFSIKGVTLISFLVYSFMFPGGPHAGALLSQTFFYNHPSLLEWW